MGGKGSGRPGGVPKHQNPVRLAGDPRAVDPRDNHAAAVFARALYELTEEEVDLADPEAVKRRFFDFLDVCDKAELRPMMTGLAMAYGIQPGQLSKIGQGNQTLLSEKLTPKSRAAIQKAYSFMRASWETFLQQERGNPVKWIVLGKNFYGIQDQVEQVVTHREEVPALASPEEVASKYAALVGREPKAIEVEATVEPADSPEG